MTTAIQRFLRSKRKCFSAVASFSVAAQLLNGGCTAHCALGIPFSVTSKSTCNIKADSQLGHGLSGTHFVIWDEIVMAYRQNLDAGYCIFRRLKNLFSNVLKNLPNF